VGPTGARRLPAVSALITRYVQATASTWQSRANRSVRIGSGTECPTNRSSRAAEPPRPARPPN
jgi:hypothetical protein